MADFCMQAGDEGVGLVDGFFDLWTCEGLALEVARWLEEGGWIEGGISLCDMCLMERWVCD